MDKRQREATRNRIGCQKDAMGFVSVRAARTRHLNSNQATRKFYQEGIEAREEKSRRTKKKGEERERNRERESAQERERKRSKEE